MAALARRATTLLLALAAAGCAHRAPEPAAHGPVAPRDRVVVMISIDGLPAYAFRDPRLPVPTLRRLRREGVTAAGGMRIVNPAVTWPNHATLATGVRAARHGLLYNGRLLRPGPRAVVKVEQRDRADLLRVPTVYDLAHASGLRTAQVDWIPHQVGGTISWAFPERPSPDGPLERELVAAGVVALDDLTGFRNAGITFRDELWTRAGAYILRRYQPSLSLFHLLNLDATHHRYGPGSLAGTSAIALADARIREMIEAATAAGLGDRLTLFVVSDHGFKEVRRQIKPHAVLRAAGLVEVDERGAITAADASILSEGGTAMVYVSDPARRSELVPRLKELLGTMEGVDKVIEPSEFAAYHYPLPEQNDQMSDLVLVAKAGYAFSGAADGDPIAVLPEGSPQGAHGYVSSDPDMNATFIAWGAGIRAGTPLGEIDNVDVAPTLAAVLGLELRNVEGRVLHEILW